MGRRSLGSGPTVPLPCAPLHTPVCTVRPFQSTSAQNDWQASQLPMVSQIHFLYRAGKFVREWAEGTLHKEKSRAWGAFSIVAPSTCGSGCIHGALPI